MEVTVRLHIGDRRHADATAVEFTRSFVHVYTPTATYSYSTAAVHDVKQVP